jgi:hypothetical protein
MYQDVPLPKTCPLFPAVIAVSLLMVGCSAAPIQEVPVTAEVVPELTLNLEEKDCNCVEQTVLDYTPLERGFTALSMGEYIEAVQHFQRYLRLEKTPEAELEASIAIAYVSILPSSPFYDTGAARKSYREIRIIGVNDLDLHEQTLLMRQSLETFIQMERKINELDEDNATLTENLEKREEALKRLRELALGQKARR